MRFMNQCLSSEILEAQDGRRMAGAEDGCKRALKKTAHHPTWSNDITPIRTLRQLPLHPTSSVAPHHRACRRHRLWTREIRRGAAREQTHFLGPPQLPNIREPGRLPAASAQAEVQAGMG